MKKILLVLLLPLVLTSCQLAYRADTHQGNVISQQQLSKLKTDMTKSEVKEIMGDTLLTEQSSPNQLIYLQTFQSGYGDMQEQKITLDFKNGVLNKINKSGKINE